MSNVIIVVAIVAYLAMMLYIGFRMSNKNKNTDDFYLGGRKLGPLVTAMSAEASDMSSWLLMGLPGVAYLTGVADAAWTAIGLAIGTYLNWLLVARRIRVYTHTTNSITIPDFFADRYGDKKHILSSVAAVIIIIFFIPYTASGFAACGKLFNQLFGVNYMIAMIVSAAIIVGYCALGGFLAASTTDLIQSIVMTIAIVIVVIYATHMAGGMDAVLTNARALPGYLSLTSVYDPETGSSSAYGALTSFSMLAWGLGYFGMPHVLLRFMATEDDKKIKTSRRIATVWVVISMAVAVFIGIAGLGMTKAGALPVLADPERIIITVAQLISSHGILAAVIAGVILSGILASTMSTSDSQLLAASSSFSQNLLQDLFGVKLTQKQNIAIARLTVVVIAVIAVFLARNPDSSVFKIVSFAWAGFGATFGPIVLLALFWKRSTLQGALSGMIVGGIMVFVWKFLIAPMGGIFGIYELLPAFVLALLVNVVVSLATPAPSADVLATFDEVQARLANKE
ncbi:sodium/proline symporter [Butyricicoccus sp.]|uniref:sodium/proline symporter n=1 Tax=Butyricicoccus sp. TaxID=2049021 RepID=UPI003D7DE4B6